MPSSLSLRLKLVLKPNIAIGPGKADLLEAIKETGSISAAGRRMGMSYRRAWLLVDTMNACFRSPVVETTKGGATGGKAVLTKVGNEVLARYRAIEVATLAATHRDRAALERLAKAD